MSNFVLQSISKAPAKLLLHQKTYTKLVSDSPKGSPTNIPQFHTPTANFKKIKQEPLKSSSYSGSSVIDVRNDSPIRFCDQPTTPVKSPRVRLFNIRSTPPSPLSNNRDTTALTGKSENNYRLDFKTLKFRDNWGDKDIEKCDASILPFLRGFSSNGETADLTTNFASDVNKKTEGACQSHNLKQPQKASTPNSHKYVDKCDGTPILLHLLHSKLHQGNAVTVDGQKCELPNVFCISKHSPRTPPKSSNKNAVGDISVRPEAQNLSSPVWISDPVCINTPIKDRLLIKGLEGFEKKPYILGRGGFGVVVLIRHKGRQLAMKIIKKNCKRRRSVEIAIQNEENAIGLDQHPNIVQTLNICGLNEQHALIMMEFAGTRHLASILEDGEEVIDHIRRLNFATQIASALQWCHGKRIVHLDVKPANVVVSSNDTCKLGDFGCSKHIDKLSSIEDWHLLGGTIAYRAPELLRENKVTLKADVYSFAITLWQLLTRESPFFGWDAHTIVYQVVACNVRPKSPAVHDSLTSKYISFYSRLWLRDLEMRPTMEDAVKILQCWSI